MEQGEVGKTIKAKIRKVRERFKENSKPKEFSSFSYFADFANKNSDRVVVEATEKETLYESGFTVKRDRHVLKEFVVELRGVKDDDSGEKTVCNFLIPCGEIELDKGFSFFDLESTDISSEVNDLRLKCFAVIDHRLRLIDEDKRGKTIYFGKELHKDTYDALSKTVKNLGISPVL